MAPNLAAARAQTEALDSHLRQIESHESLEVTQDDRTAHQERFFTPDHGGFFTQEESEKTFSLDGSTATETTTAKAGSGESDGFRDPRASKVDGVASSAGSDSPAATGANSGKSLTQTSRTNGPDLTHDFPMKSQSSSGHEETFLKHLPSGGQDVVLLRQAPSMGQDETHLKHAPSVEQDEALLNPAPSGGQDQDEALLKHAPSEGQDLKDQQGALLEEALKETQSVVREEEEWAVAEKQLAEDMAFAKTVEEFLQSSPNGGAAETEKPPAVAPVVEYPSFLVPVRGSSRDSAGQGVSVTPTGTIHVTTPGVYYDANYSGDTVPVSPGSGFPTWPPRISASPSAGEYGNQDPRIADTIRVISKGDRHQQRPHPRDSIPLNPSPTSDRRPTSAYPRRRTDTRTYPSSTASPGDRKNVFWGSNFPSGNRNPPFLTTTTETPPGLLRIPGHEPEVPADLDLVHHDLSLPFLRGQGAKVLNTDSAMTAQGATAVILSAMCVLFLALIGLTYFFQQLRQRRLDAKLAAHVPGHRVFTTDGGTASYQLQPAPIATLKPSQVTIKPQQPRQVIFEAPVSAQSEPLTIKGQPMTSKQPFSLSATYPQQPFSQSALNQDGGHGSKDNMADRIAEKNKMAAGSSDSPHRPDRVSTGSLPSYEEVQKKVLVARSSSSRKGKLWYCVHYDERQEALLLHLQQASLPQARHPAPVWVEAVLLTLSNAVHTRTATAPTTASRHPVFGARLAFQVERTHLSHLLLRLTLYSAPPHGGPDTALGSVILLLSDPDLSSPNPTIADLN